MLQQKKVVKNSSNSQWHGKCDTSHSTSGVTRFHRLARGVSGENGGMVCLAFNRSALSKRFWHVRGPRFFALLILLQAIGSRGSLLWTAPPQTTHINKLASRLDSLKTTLARVPHSPMILIKTRLGRRPSNSP